MAEAAPSPGLGANGLVATVLAVLLLLLALRRMRIAVQPVADMFNQLVRAAAAALMTLLLIGVALVLMVAGVILR